MPTVSLSPIESRWHSLVRLAASANSGYSSAISILSRFGSAAHGDPIYGAGIQLAHLLLTVFLCDLFVKESFRHEHRHVLNRGESVNALKRAIYVGRVASYQARREEMQAVADALSFLPTSSWPGTPGQMQMLLTAGIMTGKNPFLRALIGRIAPTQGTSVIEASSPFS